MKKHHTVTVQRIYSLKRYGGNDGLRFATKDEVLVPMNDIVPTTDGVKKADAKPVSSEEIVHATT